jgi:hypothetical protein
MKHKEIVNRITTEIGKKYMKELSYVTSKIGGEIAFCPVCEKPYVSSHGFDETVRIYNDTPDNIEQVQICVHENEIAPQTNGKNNKTIYVHNLK